MVDFLILAIIFEPTLLLIPCCLIFFGIAEAVVIFKVIAIIGMVIGYIVCAAVIIFSILEVCSSEMGWSRIILVPFHMILCGVYALCSHGLLKQLPYEASDGSYLQVSFDNFLYAGGVIVVMMLFYILTGIFVYVSAWYTDN